MLLIHFIYMYQKLYDKLIIYFSVHYIYSSGEDRVEYSGTRGLTTSKLKKMILKIEVVYFNFLIHARNEA